ncbi:hypothetical protein SRABI27_03212 [Pedobacter sp. Bi27]|nr:hypothetical protein SRABI36_00673 [Pedobacter sp. Bi36]CAH0202059.1 hypothetical protein SRABI126_01766 [Pedobacter sp. Bi126]CAH0260640.1 hypothetical protein SRABI27_03212 [Pedobacter sp. Bi27]
MGGINSAIICVISGKISAGVPADLEDRRRFYLTFALHPTLRIFVYSSVCSAVKMKNVRPIMELDPR